ncbi:39S ribosomal protein L39, mitochondrial [Onychostruthus taczanowskii]|uniref:39S ribosomal protein L39, mitochondrial n=1 Tax=Onychostruthus taczanowskii TaxID=356909 RepID=UPI001B80A959|nr:39S ribosomal protein L39, mitochondrial [Onychostruthus taczanowskii]
MAAPWAARGVRAGKRYISAPAFSQLTPSEVVQMRHELFTKEKERQLTLHPRIEKIEVKYTGKQHPGSVFVMNKALSTPYNCAMHLSKWHCMNSVLAVVDGEIWDMYRPLTKSCEIQFLTFKDEDPEEVNKAYWRSCAMIMACVLKRAFKDEYSVNLVKAPEVPVISGAFCYDVVLDSKLNDWKPTNDNFLSLTRDAKKLIQQDLPFETLHVEAKVACEMFQHNKYKMEMIERKAAQNMEGIVPLHRFGDFVDVSEGPHIPRTSFCFQYEITAAHNLQTDQSELIRRFQGVSLPVHLKAHHTVWHKLLERSKRLVTEEDYLETATQCLEAKDGTEEAKPVSI